MRWADPLAGDRPDPEWREAAAAGGAVLAVGGLLVLVGDVSEFDRLVLGLVSAAVLAAAFAVFRLTDHRTLVTTAATGAVLGAIGLAVAVLLSETPSRGRAVVAGLIVTALLGVLFTLGRGTRPVLLGAIALSVWATALAIVIDPAVVRPGSSVSVDATGVPSPDMATRIGVVSVTVAVAYLAVAWRLDLAGKRRAATPLVAIGDAAVVVAAITLASSLEETAGGVIVAVLGLALLFAGAARGRRATAWLGTAGIGVGIVVVLGGVVDSPAWAGSVLLLLAAVLGGAAITAARRGDTVGPGHGGIATPSARERLGAAAPVEPAEAEDFLDPVATRLGPWIVHRVSPRVPDLLGVLAGAFLVGGVALLATAADVDAGIFGVAAGALFIALGALSLTVAGRGPVAMAGVPLVIIGVAVAVAGVAAEVVEREGLAALFVALAAAVYAVLYAWGPARGRPSVFTAGLGAALVALGVAIGGVLALPLLAGFPGALFAPFAAFGTFEPTVVEEPTIEVPDDLEFPTPPRRGGFEFPTPMDPFTDLPFPSEFPAEFPTFDPALCPQVPPNAPPEMVDAVERMRADMGCVGLGPLPAGGPVAGAAQPRPFDAFDDLKSRTRNAAAAQAGFGIVALGLGYLVHRRRLLGMATPLIGVGLYAVANAFPTLSGTTSLAGASAGFTVLFVAVAFLGGVMRRRVTTWLGAALAVSALLTFLAAATEDVTASSALALTIGVIAVAAVGATEERQPRGAD